MIVGVLRETMAQERRVALTPEAVGGLKRLGSTLVVEAGAGLAAGFPDAAYVGAGATMVADRAALFAQADLVCAVRMGGAQPGSAAADAQRVRRGQTLVAMLEPLWAAAELRPLVEAGATLLSLELIPRITRAQSMDILSSQATVSGYKAVLLAASHLPKMFPMMMTAAGTVKPARVLVIGAGVAGLQAIASARRNGAIVHAYDVRAAVKEQIESLGAKFVELPVAEGAEGSGGYAREQSADQQRRQQELMAGVVADSDVVITTAAVPGRASPRLVSAAMVEGMRPGSVVVDLAAEKGGNCELTRVDDVVVTSGGVTILGPANLAATVPADASQMFSRNVVAFLGAILAKDGALRLDEQDEVVAGTLVARDGQIRHAGVRQALGLGAAGQE